jgi:hypothetical protein
MSIKADRDWNSHRDKRGCTDKVKHRSRTVAQLEADRLTISLGKKMTAYKCTYCRFNTFHVGTVIESDNTRPPLVENKEKEVSTPKPNNPFSVLAPLAKPIQPEPKWTEKPVVKTNDAKDKYPVSVMVGEVIRLMDLYTSGKFPKPSDKLTSLAGYGRHYGVINNKILAAMPYCGYFDGCQTVGTTLIVPPQTFHNSFIKFLGDRYPEAVEHKEQQERKKAANQAKHKVAQAVKSIPNPNDALVAAKLKDIVKAMNELITLIEG